MSGKRKGKDDERYLWGEMLRAIQEIKPKYVIAENVFGITNIDGGLVFQQVCLDLETEGYEVQPFIIPAAAKNAPHRRDRCWFIAENTMFSRCVHGESEQERAEVWQQRNTCTGSSERIHLSERNATDTESLRINRKKELENDKRQSGERGGCNTNNISKIQSQNGITTNTNGNGFNQCNGNDEVNTSQRGKYALSNISKSNDNGDATNTDGTNNKTQPQERILGQTNKSRKTGGFVDGNSRIQWSNFPTQSPICGGDDGLPYKLDGITFSKWRAESIKGYGNAIVPQVAYEIFKQL
jgi:DNA (cytosine-5)-methyltransferase 1